MRTSAKDGTFTMEGLLPGGTVHVAVGGPRTEFIAEGRELKLPADRTEMDAGIFRLVRGQGRLESARNRLASSCRSERVNI
jgi:hypothetical protein